MKSLSEKRLLISCVHEGQRVVFLVDTGASVGLIDKYAPKSLNLKKGRKYSGTLIGAGGNIDTAYICDNLFTIESKQCNQFIFANLSDIQESIYKETGYKILGILGLPQMKQLGIKIDVIANTITV